MSGDADAAALVLDKRHELAEVHRSAQFLELRRLAQVLRKTDAGEAVVEMPDLRVRVEQAEDVDSLLAFDLESREQVHLELMSGVSQLIDPADVVVLSYPD